MQEVDAEADAEGEAKGDTDQETEDIQRDEEAELEFTIQAHEALVDIEKLLVISRESVHQDNIETLNREEAMLRADEPTHPMYRAMAECLSERKDTEIRQARTALNHSLRALATSAVATRAQILSQFQQEVRALREHNITELGHQWYTLQYERRRRMDNICDFAVPFPTGKSQQVRNIVSYNKEVSILAGVAKYRGFPAAPDLAGASVAEIEEDIEAINMNRPKAPPAPTINQVNDYSAPSRLLGPAGAQFIEQTPWANPNHPAHQKTTRLNLSDVAPAARYQQPVHQQHPSRVLLGASASGSYALAGDTMNGSQASSKLASRMFGNPGRELTSAGNEKSALHMNSVPGTDIARKGDSAPGRDAGV